jgi:hypothetical protein
MSVLLYSAAAAFSAGIVTVGAVSNAPEAVTTLFEATVGAVAEGDAEDAGDEADFDADEDDDDDGADDDDDEEQPAAAAAASMGMTRSAAARRMGTSRVGLAVSTRLRPTTFCGSSKRYPGYPQLTVGLLSAAESWGISASRLIG